MRQRGFTLIELIAVLVLMGILASISTSFVVTTIDSYRQAQLRNRLLNKGRVAVEQMTRLIRSAVPNSIRVSASGNCVEFLPSSGAAFYEGPVSDQSNGASKISSLTSSPFVLDIGAAEYAVIGSYFPSDIYNNTDPSALVALSSVSGSPITQLNFDFLHRFIRNSASRRVYVADHPQRFCVAAGQLRNYLNYGFVSTALTDVNPGGEQVVMADGITSSVNAFVLSQGSQTRGASLAIALTFGQGDVSVLLNQLVLARNVP